MIRDADTMQIMKKQLSFIFALLCLLAVQGNSQITMSQYPTSGSGSSGQVSFYAVDPAGVTDVQWMWAAYNSATPGVPACGVLAYPNANNVVYLRSTDGNSWTGGYHPGQAVTLSNAYCSVNLATAYFSYIGNTVVFTFTPVFTGLSGYVWSYEESASVNNSVYSWVNTGNWTIPGGNVPPDQVLATTREFIPAPDPSDPPAMGVSVTQANFDPNNPTAIAQYFITDQMYYRIRGAKPLSQVWVRRVTNSPDPSTDPAGWLIYQPVCATVNGQNTPALGDAVNGACLLGNTDAMGSFDWSERIWNGVDSQFDNYARYVGMVSVKFYVGAQALDPNVANTTRGPMNEDNSIGALIYWAKCPNGTPVFPAGM